MSKLTEGTPKGITVITDGRRAEQPKPRVANGPGKVLTMPAPELDNWEVELINLLTHDAITEAQAQFARCNEILSASPLLHSIPIAVYGLSDCAMGDVCDNGEKLGEMGEAWSDAVLKRMEGTEAGYALERLENLVRWDFNDSKEDQERMERVVGMLHETAAAMLGLGMLIGSGYVNKRGMPEVCKAKAAAK